MYTGEGDYSKLRSYESAYNMTDTYVQRPAFDGNKTITSYVQPFVNKTPIRGNDGAFTSPNIDKDDITVNYIYVDILYRSCGTEKSSKTIDYDGITTERFNIPGNFMENKTNNPINANFY